MHGDIWKPRLLGLPGELKKKKRASGSINKASEISLCDVPNVHNNTENMCKPNAKILLQWKMTLLVSFKKGWCMICSIFLKKVINEFSFQEWLDSASDNNRKPEKSTQNQINQWQWRAIYSSQKIGAIWYWKKKVHRWLCIWFVSQGHFPECAAQLG